MRKTDALRSSGILRIRVPGGVVEEDLQVGATKVHEEALDEEGAATR